MGNYLESLGLELSCDSAAARLRHEVLSDTPWAPTPTTNVSYVAANRLLIIAGLERAREIEATLPEKMMCYFALPAKKSHTAKVVNAHHCAGLAISGYLGRFKASINGISSAEQDGNLANIFNIETGVFDQVVDCGERPLIEAAIKPPGYHYFDPVSDVSASLLELIPELIGEFEKPRYFDYNPDICAHGRSGIPGCTRCIDACPTQAIISIGETIEVNPHLCQGGGTCASSCPAGAISYVYPKVNEQIESLRVILKSLREKNNNTGITLLFFDNEHGREDVAACSLNLAEHVVPYVVEEIGSVGLDLLASALAYGANTVLVYAPDSLPIQVVQTLEHNCEVVRSVLDQTHCQSHSIQILNALDSVLEASTPQVIELAEKFAPVGNKRSIIRTALTFFGKLPQNPTDVVRLPDASLFGQTHVDQQACTLCMGCVSVCPASALQAGGDTPALRFIEANCVQCGICCRACPESAITLEPRLHFDVNVVNKAHTHKEEAPFRCIDCGKPFATRAMIDKMTEKLKGHWMYEKPDAFKRLQMCEDCRVKDMFDKNDMIS